MPHFLGGLPLSHRLSPQTIGATTKKALLRYMVTWRPEPHFDDVYQVILSTDGTPLTYCGLAPVTEALGCLVCPLTSSGTPEVRSLMNGGDVMTLRLTRGHTRPDVTQM